MVENILIAHLVSNGDCLMVTTLARQIKNDYPNCHLTWAISSKCKQVIINNPYVDNIWEIEHNEKDSLAGNIWYDLKKKIQCKKFDKVFYTQINPDYYLFYDGTTRSSTFNLYPNKITVPVEPIIRLFDAEIENVKKFVNNNNIENYVHKLIFECSPSSGQSAMNLEMAIAISEILTQKIDSLVVIISTHINFSNSNSRIINGSSLTFRENVELSKYCTFLVGCSSGISWLLTSDWAKQLKTVQILKRGYGFGFASMVYDFEYWKLNTSHIIETDICDKENTSAIIIEALSNFELAKHKYHQIFRPNFQYFLDLLTISLIKKKYIQSYYLFLRFSKRNNVRWLLVPKFIIHIFKIIRSKIQRKIINRSTIYLNY